MLTLLALFEQGMSAKNFQPPSNWAEFFRRIVKYRKALPAPVDTIGCDCLLDTSAPKHVQRFQTLVALMLSSQTKDEVTAEAMGKLLKDGLTPENVDKMSEKKLNEYIIKVGFHNNKTKYIKAVSKILIERYNSTPPKTYEELIALPGVGPKMAHLFFQAADNQVYGIGVDTHVHRLCQRFHWVPDSVKTPEDTRKALESWLPKQHWSTINHHLVGLGQTVCTPINPMCAQCELQDICPNAFKEGNGTRSAGNTKRKLPLRDLEDLIVKGSSKSPKRKKGKVESHPPSSPKTPRRGRKKE